ncbi:MAG TPA: metallopeptidase, partial [Pirellulales bacterium]|nr:metallopeptidase [Pirellulales bacterium]
MRTIVAALAVALATSIVWADDEPVRPKPAGHATQQVEGWTVHVDRRLIEGDADDVALGKHARRLLDVRLYEIAMVVPEAPLAHLRKVPIWLDRTHGKLERAQYHPSADWLKANGYDPKLARCVHIPDAAEWSSARHQQVQPWSVLHELAHAYHDQVLGFDNPEIAAAWERFRSSGKYDEPVLHTGGTPRKHYALTNPMEFFAEFSES